LNRPFGFNAAHRFIAIGFVWRVRGGFYHFTRLSPCDGAPSRSITSDRPIETVVLVIRRFERAIGNAFPCPWKTRVENGKK
jgi:hypothetical protein